MTKYLKALYAAVHAGLISTGVAYTAGHGHIGYEAGIVIATAVVTAFGVVWGVPNSPTSATVSSTDPGNTSGSVATITTKVATK